MALKSPLVFSENCHEGWLTYAATAFCSGDHGRDGGERFIP